MATLVQQAITSLPRFGQSYKKFFDKLVTLQYSMNTINGYCSKVASVCLHLGKLPEELSSDEINSYLSSLLQASPGLCRSFFVHTVVGLRSYYKHLGFEEKHLILPPIKSLSRLPVILSGKEILELLGSAKDLRSKSLLGLLYSSGLRIGEACRLEIADIDSDRMLLHIRQSKRNRDRYVPLSASLLPVLRAYYREYRPQNFLFTGLRPGTSLNVDTASHLFRSVCTLWGGKKHITCHSLRHAYATHLLEMGENIFRIKELLGHKYIRSTFIYLHVAKVEDTGHAFSPLDVLLKNKKE